MARVSEVVRAARAHRQLLRSVVGGVSTRMVRGGLQARRMVVRLTKGVGRRRGGGWGGVAAFLRGRRCSRGGGARRCLAGGELTGVDLEAGEEKGTSRVLIEVKVAPEVDRSGSATRRPRRRVDDVDRWLWRRFGNCLGQEAAGRSVGGRGVLHPDRKA
jgi:hypothetical protein